MTWVHSSSEDKITFWPPLHLQRQAWALGVLRSEQAASVLDIGCGEGSLIQALCSPSPTVHERPILPSTASPEPTHHHPHLHVKRLGGLDLDAGAVRSIILPLSEPDERWTPLAVDLWHGDLGQFNEELNDYQAMVALEVIEHLPEETLQRFGAIVLGEYRPSLLLVTTPNFEFNVRFDREGEQQKGWKDPTGRTDRIFRHDDHKFEWTPDEFRSWCEALADEYGYIAEPTLIGPPSSPCAPPPTPSSTHATNACLFRLSPVPSSRTSRSPRSFRTSSLPFLHATTGQDVQPETHHRLERRTTYEPRPDTGKPRPPEEIRDRLREVLGVWSVGEVGLDSVWREMRAVCGGSKRALVGALGGWGNAACPVEPPDPSFDPAEWELSQRAGDADAKLVVRWTKFVAPRPTSSEDGFYSAPRTTYAPNDGGDVDADDGGWGA